MTQEYKKSTDLYYRDSIVEQLLMTNTNPDGREQQLYLKRLVV